MLAKKLLREESRAVKVGGISIGNAASASLFGIRPTTTSGVDVDEDVAGSFTLFAAARQVISRALAKVPLNVYQRVEGGKELARDHWLFSLLHAEPNPDMSSIDWRERAWGDFLTYGNHISLSSGRQGGGPVERFDPIPWNQITVLISPTDGRPLYSFAPREGGEFVGTRRYTERVAFRPEEVIHLKSGGSGIVGASTVQTHAQAIGNMIATERHVGSFFGNGAWVGGVLEHPGHLGAEASERLQQQ